MRLALYYLETASDTQDRRRDASTGQKRLWLKFQNRKKEIQLEMDMKYLFIYWN